MFALEVVQQFEAVFGPVEVLPLVGVGAAPVAVLPFIGGGGGGVSGAVSEPVIMKVREVLAPARNRACEVSHGASSSSLEDSTHFDKGLSALAQMSEPRAACWRVDVLDFGEGTFEALACYQTEPLPRRRIGGQEEDVGVFESDRSKMDLEDLRRSVQRSRRAMRHKVMMMKADRLLTITARADMSRKEFERATVKFIRSCRRNWPDFSYVIVFEQHKDRDSYHAHIALNCYYDVNRLRFYWHKALGWKGKGIARGVDSPGNIDMTSPRRGYWNRHKIASYLTKYMAKGEDGEKGQKRYISSQNIAKPRRVTFWVPVCSNPLYFIKKIIQEFIGVKLVKFWECNDSIRPVIWYAT